MFVLQKYLESTKRALAEDHIKLNKSIADMSEYISFRLGFKLSTYEHRVRAGQVDEGRSAGAVAEEGKLGAYASDIALKDADDSARCYEAAAESEVDGQCEFLQVGKVDRL